MSIACDIACKSTRKSQSILRGRITQNTDKYIVYKFSDNSELVFFKKHTGTIDYTKYTICDF